MPSQTLIAAASNAVCRPMVRRARWCSALVAIALAVSASGSERESSRVLEMIEAKYGVSVRSCLLDQSTVKGRAAEQWRCDLSSPRTDARSGVTSTSCCVTNASPNDEFESAHLAYARAGTAHG
jgi:hypothetical protein